MMDGLWHVEGGSAALPFVRMFYGSIRASSRRREWNHTLDPPMRWERARRRDDAKGKETQASVTSVSVGRDTDRPKFSSL